MAKSFLNLLRNELSPRFWASKKVAFNTELHLIYLSDNWIHWKPNRNILTRIYFDKKILVRHTRINRKLIKSFVNAINLNEMQSFETSNDYLWHNSINDINEFRKCVFTHNSLFHVIDYFMKLYSMILYLTTFF